MTPAGARSVGESAPRCPGALWALRRWSRITVHLTLVALLQMIAGQGWAEELHRAAQTRRALGEPSLLSTLSSGLPTAGDVGGWLDSAGTWVEAGLAAAVPSLEAAAAASTPEAARPELQLASLSTASDNPPQAEKKRKKRKKRRQRREVPPVPQRPAAARAFDFGSPPWHLVSVPDEPDDVDPATLLSTVAPDFTLAYAYDTCDATSPWRLYDPADPGSSDLTAVDHRIGVWLKGSNPDPLAVSGTEPAETSIQLCEGWNLIGYPLAQDRPVLAALSSILGKFQRVYGFDPADPVEPWQVYDVGVPDWANTLDRMERGRGYWIYALEDTTLTMKNVGPPPEVEITSPEDGAAVTYLTEVLGSVRSDLLDRWSLSHRRVGEGTGFIEFAVGNTPVVQGFLGTFDPTLLLNGLYELKLEATDFSGQTTSVSLVVAVEGQAKIGHFRLEFLDLETLIARLPIQVVRTYDSRDKRVGDFGVGWRLSMTDVDVQENGIPGDNWRGTVSPGPFPTYCIVPNLPHIVAVIFPDGEVFRFQVNLSPSCQPLVPPQVTTISYTVLGDTRATLRAIDQSDQLLVVGSFPGPVQVWDQFTTTIYDPEAYELTLLDGTRLVVSEREGLLSLIDPNGDRLDFGDVEIEHSSGRGATFERDEEGRITQISDMFGETLVYEYDNIGDLVAFTDADQEVTRYEYGADHFLERIIDPDGRVVAAAEYADDSRLIGLCGLGEACHAATHDLVGQVETITDPTGRTLVYNYDDRGNVTTATDSGGNVWSFEYNALDLPVKMTDPTGAVTRMTYDSFGNMTSVEEPHGPQEPAENFTTTFTYDSRGLRTSATNPAGGQLLFSYDSAGNFSQLADENGNVLIGLAYDAAGHEMSETGPFGTAIYQDTDPFGNPRKIIDEFGSSTIDYDAAGRMTGYEEDGRIAAFEYDSRGRTVLANYGNGSPVSFEYGFDDQWVALESPATGRIEREISPGGQLLALKLDPETEVRFTYDSAGRILSQSVTPESTLEYEYDEAGNQSLVRSPRGAETRYVYDGLGRPTEIRNALGHPTILTYRPNGELESTTNALGRTWTIENTPTTIQGTDPLGRETIIHYNKHGLPLETIHPDGFSQVLTYLLEHPLVDGDAYPASITDEIGRIRRFTYDPNANIKTATNPGDDIYQYAYTQGLLTKVTDPIGATIDYTYDVLDRIETITRADGRIERLDYDVSGEISRRTLPSGTTHDFEYDPQVRLTARRTSGGIEETYTWDPVGGLSTATGSTGTVRKTYDLDGELESLVHPDGSSVVYERDLLGQVISVTTQLAPGQPFHRTRYSYDAVGNLIAIEDPLGGTTSISYDVVNRPMIRELPNGITTTWTYDLRDRVTSITHRAPDNLVISSVTYIRSPSGEPERVTYEDGTYVELSYDGALRLIEERYKAADDTLVGTIIYTYDESGNRLSRVEAGEPELYTYGSGHRLASLSSSSGLEEFIYDADGRLTTITGVGDDRSFAYDDLDRLSTVSEGGLPLASYVYDAEDRRVNASAPAAISQRLVAPVGNGALESTYSISDGTGALAAGYVYAGSSPLLRFSSEGATYYLTDALGSVIALADASGEEVAQFRYDGFGRIRSATGSAAALPEEAGGDFRFHGSWRESSTGLYHMRARDYDPRLGVFLSRDPGGPELFFPESFHPYMFANNNPFLFKDPTGERSLVSFSIAGAVQSILNVIRVSFARNILRNVVRRITIALKDQVLGFIQQAFLEAIGANEFLGKIGADVFEEKVVSVFCRVFGFASSVMWIEPKIEVSGRPVADGYHCPADEDKQRVARSGKQAPRPDLLFSRKRPTAMKKPFPFQSFLVGDIKISVYHANKTWRGDQKRQKMAIKGHARRYGTYTAILVALKAGQQKTCSDVRALFFPPVTLVVQSVNGMISRRKNIKC